MNYKNNTNETNTWSLDFIDDFFTLLLIYVLNIIINLFFIKNNSVQIKVQVVLAGGLQEL